MNQFDKVTVTRRKYIAYRQYRGKSGFLLGANYAST
jgi:hypothetical protein